MTRMSAGVYEATNAAGVSMTFGQGEGLIPPEELLLGASSSLTRPSEKWIRLERQRLRGTGLHQSEAVRRGPRWP